MASFPRFDLTSRVALVTGGSRGLGLAMARGFAEHGADVMICSRHEEELKQAVAHIGKDLDVRVDYLVVDMSDRGAVEEMGRRALERFGKVDILVNNAGSNVPQPIDEIRDEDWDRILELNLSSIMALTRSLVPQMKERKWGRIIHISSILGLGSVPSRNVYSATKSALIGLAKASALDLGPFGITVNCIAPGSFLTDLPRKLFSEAQQEEFSKRTALGRWGSPEELAGPAILLASEAGSYITGAVLVVDGGAVARAL